MTKQQITLVIVDDSPEDRATYRRYLSEDQQYIYQIWEEESGEKGLELCRQIEPDGVLLDLQLPDLDGLEFLRELKCQNRGIIPGVIILTGHGNESIAVQAIKGGASDYLVKGKTSIECLHCAVHNATENAKIRREWQQSQERLKLALSAAGMGTWEWNIFTDQVWVSENVPSLFGLQLPTRTETLSAWLRHVHPGDRDSVIQTMLHAVENRSRYFQEYRLLVDDKICWVCAQGQVFCNQNGEPAQIVGTIQDITERKQTRAELEHFHERFDLVTRAVDCMIYDWDIKSDRVQRTESLIKKLGYTPQEAPPTAEWWSSIVHPDDLQRVNVQYQASLATGDSYKNEYRVRHKSEPRYLWVRDMGYVLRDGEGRTVRAVGITIDITERQQTQAQLQESIERTELATTAAELGMWFWNLTTNELVWTDKCKQLFGFSPDTEISYDLFLECLHPEDRQRTHETVSRSQQEKIDYDIEYRSVWQDGSIHWMAAKGRTFYNPQGQPVRMMGIVQEITERKNIEQQLTISQQRLELAQSAGQIGTFDWDMQTGVITWTAQQEEIFGVPIGKFGGRIDNWRELVHPEDLPTIEQSLQQTIAHHIPDWYAEFRIFRADTGELRWLAGKGRFFYNQFGEPLRMIGTNIDITQRQEMEKALRESEQRYRYLANFIPEMVWTTNTDGEIDYVNQRWYEYSGLTWEETIGNGWHSVVHPDDLEKAYQLWSKAVQTNTDFQSEHRYRRAVDGTYRWHLVRAFPVRDDHGNVIKWLGTNIDIEELKQLQLERQELLEREQAANRAKDNFIAMVSHDLRAPLNAILGWTKLLQSGKLDQKQTAKALETIERSAKNQAKLIEDLLDVSRMIQGKLRVVIAPVDLKNVIQTAVEQISLVAIDKQINLEVKIDSAVGYISGDEHRLQQIVANLLSNAVKFTPKGGRVEVYLQRVDSHAQIQVIDTGKGMSAEFLPHVFDRFRQEDRTTTRANEGLGLGLAIVRHLVELHGGTIQADSLGEGLGATFTVMLPLIAQQESVLDKLVHRNTASNC
ncbi:MAG: PAS domain-containing protein [Nostocaceae cyanobacterium]|nr:PAS domain-containing protein [Nostocaceae cyanobacterium]